ncbi:MAG TPA: quinone-dependent dihydroorotate dehydrogenase [Patescibacteria group bacterium]|nr:quinone-dependent dihydroorotate dehydrogenase [Patescibacteria group bacterium]
MNKYKVINSLYKTFFKPAAFLMDAETVHDQMTRTGEFLENYPKLVEYFFSYKNKNLEKEILGIKFDNPIGLSAGFDYDGHLAQIMKNVGFGFNTVGTVTYDSYQGNKKPRLARLPKSKSLLVNKGFKSEGAKAIAKRLNKKKLEGHVIGISIGDRQGNIKNIIKVFEIFKDKNYAKYFELNISCPNIPATDAFSSNPERFENLVKKIKSLKVNQPIFLKMPNEIDIKKSDKLVFIAKKYGIQGFIFSNLVKDRNNPAFDKKEIKRFENKKGNFSGKPTFENSNKLIKHTRKKFGNKIIIIGTGGIFDAHDAKMKLNAGADLVQLITGMIYEGPQIAGSINSELSS